MSVLIKNMRMPTSCSECAFCGYYGKGDHVCDITGKDVVYELSLENRLGDCPLAELPPHGDLIDYNFCFKNYELLHDDDGNPVYAVRMRDINAAPTIIEAEVSE